MNARLDLAAFLRAILAGFRHRLAFFILKKLVAFLLAGRANLLNDLGDSRREGRIDRRERFQRAASGDGVMRQLQTLRHACVIHGDHLKAMAHVVFAIQRAFGRGVGQGFVFGRVMMRMVSASMMGMFIFGARRHGASKQSRRSCAGGRDKIASVHRRCLPFFMIDIEASNTKMKPVFGRRVRRPLEEFQLALRRPYDLLNHTIIPV